MLSKRIVRRKLVSMAKRSIEQAYPGDTYINDLNEATNSTRPWVSVLTVVMVLSGIADWFILSDLFNLIIGSESIFDLISAEGFKWPPDDPLKFYEGLFAAMMIIAGYLVLGRVIGKMAQEYTAFGHKRTKTILLVVSIIEAIILLLTVVARFYGSVEKVMGNSSEEYLNAFEAMLDPSISFEALLLASLLLVIMVIGIGLSIISAYYSGSAVAETTYKQAKEHLALDALLYRHVYLLYAADPSKDREYESQEHQIDKQMDSSIRRLEVIASELNGILDPADANDFRTVNSRVSNVLYE